MKRRCFCILGIVLLLLMWLFIQRPAARFEQIYSFSEINWDAIHGDALVVFDLDGVLVMPADRMQSTSPTTPTSKPDMSGNAIWSQSPSKTKLVEPMVLEVLQNLRARKIKMVGLTYCLTGSLEDYPNVEDWRVADLKLHGIDFSDSFPEYPFHQFAIQEFLRTDSSYPVLKGGEYPVLKNGLLVTNLISKGKVLLAFLDYVSWTPSEIIFIDDRQDFLEDVQASCKKRGIAFKGFQFYGAQKSNRQFA